jgi:glutamate racemase
VIEPGAEAACRASHSGHIAVIATEGTVRGGAYQDAIVRRRSDTRVSAVPAQLFVALAEEGLCRGPIAESVARHYLEPIFNSPAGGSRPDTLVLGCTHFPMLADSIRAVAGPGVAIVDSAETTARHVRQTLEAENIASRTGEACLRLLATDAADRFARIGGRFLERPIRACEVELIDL